MKLAIASLLVGSAAAFAPAAPVGMRSSALNMAETATETAKVSMFQGRILNTKQLILDNLF